MGRLVRESVIRTGRGGDERGNGEGDGGMKNS